LTRRKNVRRVATPLFALGLAALLSPAAARADVLLYSNTTNFLGFGYSNGGAANQAGDTITSMVADDITAGAGLGGLAVNQFGFSVVNFNAAAVSARVRVRFYQGDGANGGPGTFITGFTFNPITFGAGSVSVFNTALQAAPYFTMPTTTFWAGMTFDDNTGGTGATAAQLNNLGQGIFNPPTVGSSQDVFFQTTAAGSFLQNNPGGGFFFFGGSPVANFGWSFFSSSAPPGVPEPSPVVLSAAAGLIALAVKVARRRRAA
jgi:hypothetical protein